MRPVLVTGGAGFIGSNIVAGLVSAGYDVAVCDRLRTAACGKWRNLAKHPIIDLVPPEALDSWLHANGALEAVIHMGAVSATTEPDADYILDTNFRLSKRVFDWCALNGVRLIYASSAATYGGAEEGFHDADDLAALGALRPLNAYGWSKSLFDLYARRSADRGRAPPQWAGLKFFNVYGPNEGHKGPMRSVAAQLWDKIAAREPVTLFRSHRPEVADGGQKRDFVYVKDVERFVLWLLSQPQVSGIFNVGSGEARSFLDLAKAVFAATDHGESVRYVDTPPAIRDAYQYFTQADLTRVRAAGYDAAFMTLEAGVKEYLAGYLAAADPYR